MQQHAVKGTLLLCGLALTLCLPCAARAQTLGQVDPVRVISVGEDSVELAWLPVEGAGAYEVRVISRPRSRFRSILTVQTRWAVDRLHKKGRYRFKVRALLGHSRGPWSSRVRVNMRRARKAFGPPRLKNLLVDLSDPNTFVFTRDIPKNFVEFGGTFERMEGATVIPAFAYFTQEHTPVHSPIKGMVRRVSYQEESQDFEIEIARNRFTAWMVVIDHVTDVRVRQGKKVKAGDVVGAAARYLAADGVWRTELEVGSFEHYHCPFALFDPESVDTFKQQVNQVMAVWEAFAGDSSLYDEAAMEPFAPACLHDSYPRRE